MAEELEKTIEGANVELPVSLEAILEKRPYGVAQAEFGTPTTNIWTDARKSMNKVYDFDKFVETTSLCRFFYRTEPVVSTVINKLVEIGINDLVFSKNGLSDNEFRVFKAIKPKLLEFSEQMALEYLLSGLVVPEVGYKKVNDKGFIFSLGVKRYSSLVLPDSMSVRNPKTIKIYTHWLEDHPTYYIQIPDEVIRFILEKGKFSDGKENKELYENLKKFYPEFVKKVLAGEKEILLENDNIIRRNFTSDNPYPISYISASLDALQHKRKLRRMDYSLIDKIISAILHVKVGNDEYPITEAPEDQEYVSQLLAQFRMRGNNDQLLERIFQLVTNHTVDISWVFPNTDILLNPDKYNDINQEILFGLGFPRVMITGEAQRSGTTNPELAMIAPVKTMESFRSKIIQVVKDICREVSMRNKFKNAPDVEFKSLNLHSFSDFLQGLSKLYDASALSRTELARVYGVDFLEQVDLLEKENELLTKKGLPLYGPSPFSANTSVEPGGENNPQNSENPDEEEDSEEKES